MATWSGIRHKLEHEYLAESLRGRIQYFATTYRESHDQEGRAAIRLDGKEVLRGNFFNYYLKAHLLPESYRRLGWEFDFTDEATMNLGMFDQRSFYVAFEKFDNQSIDESLSSPDLMIRIFAILDRRVGKRRLIAMKEQMKNEPQILQFFYLVRTEAEGYLI